MNIELYNPTVILDSTNPGSATTGGTLLERAYNLERRRMAAQTWQEVLNLHTPASARLIEQQGLQEFWLSLRANPQPWSQASSAVVSFGDAFTGYFLVQQLPWAASREEFDGDNLFFTEGYRCQGQSLLFDTTLESQGVANIISTTPPVGLAAALHSYSDGGTDPAGFTLTCAGLDTTLGVRQVSANGTLHLVLRDESRSARLSATLANPADWEQYPVWNGVRIGLVDVGPQRGQGSVIWSTAGGDKECGSYEVAVEEGTDVKSVTIMTHVPEKTDVPVTFDSLFPDFASRCVEKLNAWSLTNITMTGRNAVVNARSENSEVYNSPDVKRSGYVTGVVPLGITASYAHSSSLRLKYGTWSRPVALTGSTQSTVKFSVDAIGIDWSDSKSGTNGGWAGSVSTQGTLDCSLSTTNPIQIGNRGIARAKLLSDAKVSLGFVAATSPDAPKKVVFTLYVQTVRFPVAIFDNSRQFTYDDDPLDSPGEQLGFTGALTSFSATIPDEKWQQLFGN